MEAFDGAMIVPLHYGDSHPGFWGFGWIISFVSHFFEWPSSTEDSTWSFGVGVRGLEKVDCFGVSILQS